MKYLREYLLIALGLITFISCTKKQDFTENVLHRSSKGEVKGMDPVRADDLYSGREIARMYEGLFEYHYLKRPYEIIPNLADGKPVVSDDGLVYKIKIHKGVRFHDNKCFPGGKGRELVANDFVYSIKRMADARVNSSGWWLLDGKIKGLNDWRKKYSGKKANYDDVVDGLKAIDKYTVQFTLSKPFPQFLYALAMPFTYAVAREAVETYGDEIINNPVGTGPFLLEKGKFTQSNKIRYYKNPGYRDRYYPSEGNAQDKLNGMLAPAGKKIPLMDKIVVHVIPEDQPRWLNFIKGNLGFLVPPKDNKDMAIADGELTPEMKAKGIILSPKAQLDVTFRAFNHEHPLFKNNVNLRRAMSLAMDSKREIELFYKGSAVVAHGAVPPGIAGNNPRYKNPYKTFSIEKAKEYLKKAGYPGGKGLDTIVYETISSTTNRQLGEFFQKSMKKIGVDIKVSYNTWPELQKKVKTKNNMMYGMAWSADYPDAENFLQLLYGPNSAPGANGSNFNNKEVNAMFEKVSQMQASPERSRLYEQLNQKIAELVPWLFGVHRQEKVLVNPWITNYRYHEMPHGMDKYINVDLEIKKKSLSK